MIKTIRPRLYCPWNVNNNTKEHDQTIRSRLYCPSKVNNISKEHDQTIRPRLNRPWNVNNSTKEYDETNRYGFTIDALYERRTHCMYCKKGSTVNVNAHSDS
jgi:hypothetical protein